jgi:predicted nuclease with TOPRIM domain
MSDLQHELDVINKKVKKCKKKLKRSELAQQLKQLKQERSLLKIRVNELEDVERKKQHELDKQTLIDLGFELRTGFEVISQDYVKRMYEYVIVHENAPKFTSLSINNGVPNIEVLAIHCEPNYIWESAWYKWSSLTIDEQNELLR